MRQKSTFSYIEKGSSPPGVSVGAEKTLLIHFILPAFGVGVNILCA